MAVTLTRTAFCKTLKQMMRVAPRFDVRHYLNGVQFEISKKKVRMVATDGRRIFAVDLRVKEGSTAAGNYIVTYEDCKKMLSSIKINRPTRKQRIESVFQEVVITAKKVRNSTLLIVTADNVQFTLEPIDGTFPDYRDAVKRALKAPADYPVECLNPNYVADAGICLSGLSSYKPPEAITFEKLSSHITRFAMDMGQHDGFVGWSQYLVMHVRNHLTPKLIEQIKL